MPKHLKDRRITQAEGVLTAKLQRAIEHYLDCRDVAKAAALAGLEVDEFRAAMNRAQVRKEIDRKIELEDKAIAELRAKARVLTPDFLDQKLVVAASAGAKKGDTKAIELGYERLGLRRDDNFMTQAQASEQTRPLVYRVLEHTVTHTEQVTQRALVTGHHPAAQLPAPEHSEILDY